MTWNYGSEYTYETARQEVINRIATIAQPLPPNVTPVISPESPTGEIYRYILKVPKDASGQEIYTLNDIKALQDWVLEREFRTRAAASSTSPASAARSGATRSSPTPTACAATASRWPSSRRRSPTATPPWAATTSPRARWP